MMNSRTGSSARLDALDSFLTLVSDPSKMKAQVDQLRRETTAANEAKAKATAEVNRLGDLAAQKRALDVRHADLTQREAAVKKQASENDLRHKLIESVRRDNEIISGSLRQGVEAAENKAKQILADAHAAVLKERAEHEAWVRDRQEAAAKAAAKLAADRAAHEKAVKDFQQTQAKHQADVAALQAQRVAHAKKVEQLKALVG